MVRDNKNLLVTVLSPYLESGKTYCVGFSGGGDSTALLHAACSLREDKGFTVVALHMNHCLRGAESDSEELFCREAADAFGVPIEVQRIDVLAYSKENSLSLEDAARRCRFHWFLSACRRLHVESLLLAHHADDQAETVLLRLLRGAGVRGLGGMKPVTRFHDMLLVRPWLDMRRAAIDVYREMHSLHSCNDSSNDSTRHDRNWVRHEIIPQLNRRFGPDITERLVRTAHINRDAAEYIQETAAAFVLSRVKSSIAGNVLQISRFNECHSALQREIIRQVVCLPGEYTAQLGFDMIETIRNFITGTDRNCSACLPGGILISKAFGYIIVAPGEIPQVITAGIIPGKPMEVSPGIVLTIEKVDSRGESYSNNGEGWAAAIAGEQVELIQYASIPVDAEPGVCPRRAGDRYCPVNGKEKKIKDLLINAGIPNSVKNAIPLVTVNGKPAWLAGWRIAQEYKVKNGQPVYRLTCTIPN